MPELDLGSVIGPQGPKGDKGIDGAVGPTGPQGEKGDDGAAATINGVNILTMTTGDGLEATMNGSAYQMKLADNALNAVQAVPTLVRPNLLDNWYFGNPVDQKKGYIQIGGTMMYKDAACTDQFGPSAGTTPVVVYATYARPIDHGVELALYIPLNNIVRGYTGNGYMVDRWKIIYGNGQISITDGYVSFLGSGVNFSQILDENVYKPLRGKTVTLSIIGRGDCQIVSEDAQYSYNAAFINSDVFTLASVSFLTKSDSDRFIFHIKPNTSNPVDILAAKLELGPTQTLAHREGDRWVLNEVPEYGEQLRRCQRYFVRLGDDRASQNCAIGFANCANTTTANAFISTPVSMRTTPAISLKNIKLRKGITDYDVTAINVFYATQNGIYCSLTSSGLPTGETLIVRTVSAGYMDVSADL